MGFFDIGAGELLLILVAVLLVFGPGKPPELARSLGKGIYEFKRYSAAVTKDLKEEVERAQKGQGTAAVAGPGPANEEEMVSAAAGPEAGPPQSGALPEKGTSAG